MRREEMWKAVKSLQAGLKQSGIIDSLLEALRGVHGEKTRVTAKMLENLKNWSILVANYGSTERKLIQTLGLEELDSPEFWNAVVGQTPDEAKVSEVYRIALCSPVP